jgi:hypothetical protein
VRRVGPILIAGLALTACARAHLRLDALPATGSVGAVERYGQGLVRVDPSGETLTFDLAQDAEIALVSVAPGGRVNALYPFQPGESSRFSAGPHTIVVPVSWEWAPDPSARGSNGYSPSEAELMRSYNRCMAAFQATRGPSRTASRTTGDSSRQGQEQQSAPVWDSYVTDPSERCGLPPTGENSSATPSASSWRVQNDVLVLVVSRTPLGADELRRRIKGLRIRSEADLLELPLWVAGDRIRPWAGYYSRRLETTRQSEPR